MTDAELNLVQDLVRGVMNKDPFDRDKVQDLIKELQFKHAMTENEALHFFYACGQRDGAERMREKI